MALSVRSYDSTKWVNIWDPSIDKQWIENYFVEYKTTWPNVREEIQPVVKEGEKASAFYLKSLTGGQLHAVEKLSGIQKICEIVAYGVTGWENMYDGEREKRCQHTTDDLGKRLTTECVEYLGFFGFTDLSLLNILAVQIMQISRCMNGLGS